MMMSFEISKIELNEKKEKSVKELAWGQKRKEIDEIGGRLGKGIDEGIKESVVAFNMNGLPTHNSCEGHVERGSSFPFVSVKAEDKPQWRYEGQKELFEEVAKERGIELKKLEEGSKNFDPVAYDGVRDETGRQMNEQVKKDKSSFRDTPEYSEWKKKNKEIFGKAQALFSEYHKNKEAKDIDPDTEIIMEGNEESNIIFRPKSGFERIVNDQDYIEKRVAEDKEPLAEESFELFKKLEKRRASMNDFTGFLKKKYFESSVVREKGENFENIGENDERWEEYWGTYVKNPVGQAVVKNVLNFNPEGVYLYKTAKEKDDSLMNHIIWLYNIPERSLPSVNQIPDEAWMRLKKTPEIFERTNNALLQCYDNARSFYKWENKPKGFIIEGAQGFGMEAGNIFGIRINYKEIEPLFNAIENNDNHELKRMQTHLSASFVHELTHLHREELMGQTKTEIASHIAQFIFDSRDNGIFNKQLENAIIKINEERENVDATLDFYDKAQYLALLLVGDMTAENNEKFRAIWEYEHGVLTPASFRAMREHFSDDDVHYLRTEALAEIMNTKNEDLMKRARDIQEKLGAKSIIE